MRWAVNAEGRTRTWVQWKDNWISFQAILIIDEIDELRAISS